MSVWQRVINVADKFLPGVSLPIATGYSTGEKDVDGIIRYDYEAMVKLGTDDRVSSLLLLIGSMARVAYQGIYVEPEDIYADSVIEQKEKDCVNAAVVFARRINIKELFFTYAYNMCQFGDYIERIIADRTGIIAFEPLPINLMTVVADKSQIGRADALVREKNIYVFNERETNADTIWDKGELLHLSFNSRGQYRRDLMGRQTYNVWGKAPIAVLQDMVNWKRQMINTDMKQRRRMIPREHWTVDASAITPGAFPGTVEEKIEKARKETDKILENVKNFVDAPQPDQSIVSTESVQSKILEPSSTNYRDPNEGIKQVNSFMGTPFGAPDSFLGGEIRGFAGTSMSAVFSAMRIDVICDMIAGEIEKAIRIHVGIVYPQYIEDVIPRLKIRIDSTLAQVMLEKSKVALNMGALGVFSVEEIRGAMGYSGVVQTPFKRELTGNELRSSNEQLETDAQQTGENDRLNNQSPSGQRNEQLGSSGR